MSSSLPPEQTIILHLKIHSKDSERRIKKWILGIQGVRRVDFDAERGVAIVSGTIDPPTLLMMLENYGVKAEISGHRSPLRDPDVAALLKSLPRNSAGLKAMEVTKTVRFYFRDGENGGRGNKNCEITMDYRGVDRTPYGGGLCGGHRAAVDNMHCCGCSRRNGNYSCVNSGGVFPMSWPEPGYWAFSPLGAPPWVAAGVPSAPPLPENNNSPASPLPPPPPPPGTNPFYTVFSDDNTSSSCTIM